MALNCFGRLGIEKTFVVEETLTADTSFARNFKLTVEDVGSNGPIPYFQYYTGVEQILTVTDRLDHTIERRRIRIGIETVTLHAQKVNHAVGNPGRILLHQVLGTPRIGIWRETEHVVPTVPDHSLQTPCKGIQAVETPAHPPPDLSA